MLASSLTALIQDLHTGEQPHPCDCNHSLLPPPPHTHMETHTHGHMDTGTHTQETATNICIFYCHLSFLFTSYLSHSQKICLYVAFQVNDLP